jgi:cytochrome P450
MVEMRKLVRSRWRDREDRGDVLSALLHGSARSEPGLTEEQIVGEAIQLFFGGHHTIPSTVIWLCYVLATSEENRQRLQHEVDTALEGRPPGLGDLAGMPFGEMLVKETLRFYSPTWLLVRQVQEDRSVHGHRLERGSLIWISPYLLHRDARYFHAPDRFLPDRFRKGDSVEDARTAFIPFGRGPRTCVGRQLAMMELRLVLAVIAQSRTLEITSGEPVQARASLTIRPAKEINMRVGVR